MMTSTDLIRYYAERAPEYEKIYHKPERQSDLALLHEIVRRAFTGQHVLEIACGTGYWTETLGRCADSVTATDINEEVLEIARAKPVITRSGVAFTRDPSTGETISTELADLLGQAGATQLSAIKTTAGQSVQGERLSVWLSRARLRFTGASINVLSQLPQFFGAQLPAALYRIRWLSLLVTLGCGLVAVLYAMWALQTPGVLANFGTEEFQRQFSEEDFVNYYKENPNASFAGMVWTNNAWIAAQCVAFGVTGLWVPYVLYMNAQGVGMAGGMMAAYDQLDTFFLYILPHGLMEMTAIFIAGAAGLRIFWSWVSPGRMTRAASLAKEGRSLITVALGLVLVLFISGLVEGFVTPSDLPHWARIGIGALVLAAYWTYTLVLGRRAYNAGERGDLGRFDAGEVARTS